MRAEDFDYTLPPDRIAQQPMEPRDAARLMMVDRARDAITHHRFRDLPRLLAPGDVLVANDTRVVHARLRGRKSDTGGAVEALLLRPLADNLWLALVRGNVRSGTRLCFGTPEAELQAVVDHVHDDGSRALRFQRDPAPLLGQVGELPLPPYIRQPPADPERYQTVYARVSGSAAAPTAGLHFTPELVDRTLRAGVGIAFVTLHVGADTFRPLAPGPIDRHVIHSEWAEVPPATAEAVLGVRRSGGRVVAVGTTTVRALETAAARAAGNGPAPFSGWTDLYIRPGHPFRAVDALITNFHLPRTTLLVLVAALAGRELLERAYNEAIAHGYRFYSFGDAMMVV